MGGRPHIKLILIVHDFFHSFPLMQSMKTSIPFCCKVVCFGLWFFSINSAFAETTIDQAWVDETWRDHILWRAETLSSNPNSAYTEAFCRDVQQLDPGNLRSLTLLAQVYAAKGETALLAATSLVALDLYPAESFFKHTLEKADERIDSSPLAPTDEELAVETNKFNVYYRDAIRTREIDKNLMISEIELRALLSTYPLNLNLLRELAVTYRLAKEWTMCAMVNRLAMRAYPEESGFLYAYLQSLHRMEKDDDAWRIATGELKANPHDDELLQYVAMLAIATDNQETVPYYLQLYLGEETDTGSLIQLGRSLIGKGQLPSAALVLEYVHSKDPNNHEAIYDLAVVNSVMQNKEEQTRWLTLLKAAVSPEKFKHMMESGPFPSNTAEEVISQ